MSDKTDSARTWKNPLYAGNPGSESVSRSLLLGSDLREKVRGGWALGTFVIDVPDAATLTTVALAGFEFVVLDMEHSPLDFTRLEALLNAGRAASVPMLVRPWGQDTGLIGKILDMGAHGIMAPHVGSAERAREVVDEARFPPLGKRGFSPLSKFDAIEEPLKSLDESTYVVVQIEGREALDKVGEIAAVPGIDAIFVGPYDLALSLDVQPGNEKVYAAAERIAKAVPKDLGVGIYIDDPATAGDWVNRGFAMQCVSFDGRMLASGARAVVSSARDSVQGQRRGEIRPVKEAE
jgi:2-keto-3-deoxy-L-rhamnonate aldolase RhmA